MSAMPNVSANAAAPVSAAVASAPAGKAAAPGSGPSFAGSLASVVALPGAAISGVAADASKGGKPRALTTGTGDTGTGDDASDGSDAQASGSASQQRFPGLDIAALAQSAAMAAGTMQAPVPQPLLATPAPTPSPGAITQSEGAALRSEKTPDVGTAAATPALPLRNTAGAPVSAAGSVGNDLPTAPRPSAASGASPFPGASAVAGPADDASTAPEAATAARSAATTGAATRDTSVTAPVATAATVGAAPAVNPGPPVAARGGGTARPTGQAVPTRAASTSQALGIDQGAGSPGPDEGASTSVNKGSADKNGAAKPTGTASDDAAGGPSWSVAAPAASPDPVNALLAAVGTPAQQVSGALQGLVAETRAAAPSGGAAATQATASTTAGPAGSVRTLTVELNPDHLGPVTITLRLQADAMDIRIAVSTPQALHQLEQDKHVLSAAVAALGGTAESLHLQSGSDGAFGSPQQPHASDRGSGLPSDAASTGRQAPGQGRSNGSPGRSDADDPSAKSTATPQVSDGSLYV